MVVRLVAEITGTPRAWKPQEGGAVVSGLGPAAETLPPKAGRTLGHGDARKVEDSDGQDGADRRPHHSRRLHKHHKGKLDVKDVADAHARERRELPPSQSREHTFAAD